MIQCKSSFLSGANPKMFVPLYNTTLKRLRWSMKATGLRTEIRTIRDLELSLLMWPEQNSVTWKKSTMRKFCTESKTTIPKKSSFLVLWSTIFGMIQKLGKKPLITLFVMISEKYRVCVSVQTKCPDYSVSNFVYSPFVFLLECKLIFYNLIHFKPVKLMLFLFSKFHQF